MSRQFFAQFKRQIRIKFPRKFNPALTTIADLRLTLTRPFFLCVAIPYQNHHQYTDIHSVKERHIHTFWLNYSASVYQDNDCSEVGIVWTHSWCCGESCGHSPNPHQAIEGQVSHPYAYHCNDCFF